MWYEQATREQQWDSIAQLRNGDVFRSEKYPNLTGLEKGLYLVVESVSHVAVCAQYKEDGTLLPEKYQLSIRHLINEYIKLVGFDVRARNVPYINKMCAVMGVVYDSIPNDKKAELIMAKDNSVINKILFEVKETQPKVDNTIPAEVLRAINTAESRWISSRVSRCKDNIKGYLDNIGRLDRELDLMISRLSDERRLEGIYAGTTTSQVFLDSLNTLMASGWWKFLRIDERYMFFTTPDIYLNHQGKQLHMGQYMVEVAIGELSIRVHEYKDVLTTHNHIHPHINASRGVCWGNAKEARLKAIDDRDINKLLVLLREVLTNYNPDSPYISFEHFINADIAKVRISAKPPEPPRYDIQGTYWVRLDDLRLPDDLRERLDIIEGVTYDGDEDIDAVRLSYARRIVNGNYTDQTFVVVYDEHGAQSFIAVEYYNTISTEYVEETAQESDQYELYKTIKKRGHSWQAK